jgi:GrpB-like predicted nucleotidyltransferase (UPF0157 family)
MGSRYGHRVPSREEIITFDETPAPPGHSPWVPGAGPALEVEVVEPDPTWPLSYDEIAVRIRHSLGGRVLDLEHVGSTAVPDLPAKPIIDIDLTVADPEDEAAYVPALQAAGFELRVREPWWYGHRLLRGADPLCHLHVFGPNSPELVRHRIFRDWLRSNPAERGVYARSKREAAAASVALGEHSMQYNARKAALVREIYRRAFVAAGLMED